MRKYIIVSLSFLIIGAVAGYFYHAYEYRDQIEAGKNWEASQYLDAIVYNDVTDRVKITCNLGNKKIINANETELKFSEKDFDSNGQFTGYDKNYLLQKICGISDNEINNMLEKTMDGNNALNLFEVILNN